MWLFCMRVLLLFFLSVSSLEGWAEILEGRIVAVADDDTITLLDGNRHPALVQLEYHARMFAPRIVGRTDNRAEKGVRGYVLPDCIRRCF